MLPSSAAASAGACQTMSARTGRPRAHLGHAMSGSVGRRPSSGTGLQQRADRLIRRRRRGQVGRQGFGSICMGLFLPGQSAIYFGRAQALRPVRTVRRPHAATETIFGAVVFGSLPREGVAAGQEGTQHCRSAGRNGSLSRVWPVLDSVCVPFGQAFLWSAVRAEGCTVSGRAAWRTLSVRFLRH